MNTEALFGLFAFGVVLLIVGIFTKAVGDDNSDVTVKFWGNLILILGVLHLIPGLISLWNKALLG